MQIANFNGPWVFVITDIFGLLVGLLAAVLSIVGFVDCLTRRADAFTAVGTLAKGPWLALLGVAGLLAALFSRGGFGFITMIAMIAGAVYMLDVRPALRDAASGNW